MAGLTAAIHAAARGASVDLYEANPEPGGKLGRVVVEGFPFDTGPSLLTLPWVFERLFKEAGTSLAAELQLVRVDPICRYRWADGTTWDFASDLKVTLDGLRRFAPTHVAPFVDFLATSGRRYEWGGPPFLDGPSEGMVALSRRILRSATPGNALAIAPLGTVESAARAHFTDPRLVQFVGRYATYVGGSPSRTPSPFAMMPYVEAALGAYSPRGGMYAIAEALVRVGTRLGVRYHFGRKVTALERVGGRVSAVRADNDRVEVDGAIAACGWEETHTRLLPDVPFEPRPRSLSGLVWCVGLGRPLPDLLHHNVFFSRDYPAEFTDLARVEPTWADPTVYVCVVNRSDPDLAPPGGENLFVMLNAPIDTGQDWDALAERAWLKVRERLQANGITWRSGDERVRVALSPRTLAERTGAIGGAIYGESADSFRGALFRRPNRHPTIPNLAFAGGGVHPGGGVPLAALSARHAVDILLPG